MFSVAVYKEEDYLNLEQNPTKCNQTYQKAISSLYEAQTLSDLGELDQAEIKLAQAEAAFPKFTAGPDDYDIPRILRERGKIARRRGGPENLKLAEKQICQALQMQRDVYKDSFDSHPSVATTYTDLADTLAEMNKLKADKYYKKAIKVNISVYKTEVHRFILRLYKKRQQLFENLKNKKEMPEKMAQKAEKMAQKADEIAKKLRDADQLGGGDTGPQVFP